MSEEPVLELQIETTSTCNANCHFCPYTAMDRKGTLMSMHCFRKIINETAAVRVFKMFVMHGLGEPLLDRFMEERIAYIRWLRGPEVNIELYTNGVYLTPARFDALKAAGLNTLIVSVNAVTAEQHERIMGLKGKFETVCANTDYAIANRGNMTIQTHAVVNGDYFTQADRIEFLKRWGQREYGGFGAVITENNWAGDNRTTRAFKPNEACSRALGQVYVMADGRVSTCCLDPSGKQVFGDTKTQTLREIYNSDAYTQFREAHFNNKADTYDICRTCTRT